MRDAKRENKESDRKGRGEGKKKKEREWWDEEGDEREG